MDNMSDNKTTKLNGSSSVPLYQQLSGIIREQISDGSWPEGTQIPTEQELSKTYVTSRITVRNAIDELVEDSLLIRRQGKGTFVAPISINKNPRELSSFTETCIKMGRVPGSILISSDTKIATPDQAEFFRISDRDNRRIIRIKRVRLVDGISVTLETVCFPINFNFLLAENLEGSLYEILKQHNIVPAKIVRQIDVCVANDEESGYLNVAIGTPLLLVKDYALSDRDSPIHISKQAIRPDLFKYRLELERSK